MQYNQPSDQPSNPNAPYVDGNPAAGIQGSIVPAASVEFDQREVVEVITRANVRGYSDFTGTPCAIPSNADLTQLRKAIEGFITDWQFIIDTEVTFTVHGPGAFFPDLITAFNYLGKYKITPRGHVILRIAGTSPPGNTATKYTYTQTIVANHPNNDRISILGAPMLKPVPLDDTGFASNGSSPAQRAADLTTNLAILRSCFATELFFEQLQPLSSGNGELCGIYIDGTMLQHLDAILFTNDGTATGIVTTCQGYCNGVPVQGSTTISGVAFAQWAEGIFWDAGSSVSWQGAGAAQNLWAPIIVCGCSGDGIVWGNGSFFTTLGNVISIGNAYCGMAIYPGCGMQIDGGVFCSSNGQHGLFLFIAGGGNYCNGPMLGGTAYGPSHFWKNAQWGIWCAMCELNVYGDCGAGANANGGGSINASGAAYVGCAADLNVSGQCSPPFGTIGNSNSLIA